MNENLTAVCNEAGENRVFFATQLSDVSSSLSSPMITVLLVDDKPMIGKLVERMLKPQEDILFHFCESARDAMKKADDICPTVILQDLVMPEIDGLEMVKYFRSRENTRNIPLIVLSAEEDAKVKAKAFALGANDYIVKLPNKIELIARIRYHSRAYINMLQRNAAFEALSESKKKAEREREAAENARKKITDSIQYAQMIQSSLLPDPEEIKTFFPESFFIWMPRDIVSGDFIFADRVDDGFVIAVVDCTGHGVPGAFMTIIAVLGLKKIVKDMGYYDPARILKELNIIVKTTLHQDTDHAISDDGLDATICYITDYGQLTYAGAKLPLLCVMNGEETLVKGDRQSVGYRQSRRSDINFEFTSHTIRIQRGMSFYIYSDGFSDQRGGKEGRCFGHKNFRELVIENSYRPFEDQRELLLQVFDEYKGDNERQDDVTVVGFGF